MTVFHIPRFGKKPRGPTRPTQRTIKAAQAAQSPLDMTDDFPMPAERAKPAKRTNPEAQLQRSLVIWLRHVLPKGAIVFHIPNSGFSDMGRIWNHSLGTFPGMPDLGIAHEGRVHWIEVKSEIGKVSEAQQACHEALRRNGFYVAVVRSIDGAQEALQSWGINTRIAT